MRVSFYVIAFLIFLCVFLFLLNSVYDYSKSQVVNYKEDQKIDYKVYLKKNEFYDKEYLDENMLYVASLIDKINIDFDYNFLIDKTATIDFNYKIVGDLIISNQTNDANYFNKQYVLLDSKTASMNNSNIYNIKENIVIDYDYYNSLANKFKTSFGVDTNSYLNISLVVNKDSDSEGYNISDSNSSVIKIPLSEKAIEIKFDTQESSEKNKAISDSKLEFNSKMLIIEIIVLIIMLFCLIKIIRMLLLLKNKNNDYDKYINKILKEYDRYIVNTTTGIDKFSMNKTIELNKFEELLDVRDNLKLPIMYYSIYEHQKCYFYIKNNDDIYLYKVKAVDMEDTKNGRKEKNL